MASSPSPQSPPPNNRTPPAAAPKRRIVRNPYTTRVAVLSPGGGSALEPTGENETKKEPPPSLPSEPSSRADRLPSRSLTFRSAEILTVSELVLHVAHYDDDSVRITGVLLHHDPIGRYALVGDLLVGARPLPSGGLGGFGGIGGRVARRNPYASSRPVVAAPPPPAGTAGASSSSSSSSASSPGAAASATTTKRPPPAAARSILGGGRKRKLVTAARGSGGGLGLGSGSSGSLSNRNGDNVNPLLRGRTASASKRPPPSSPVDPIESIVSYQPPASVVAVDVADVSDVLGKSAKVGDLVMVLGDVRTVPVAARAGTGVEDGESDDGGGRQALRDALRILDRRNRTTEESSDRRGEASRPAERGRGTEVGGGGSTPEASVDGRAKGREDDDANGEGRGEADAPTDDATTTSGEKEEGGHYLHARIVRNANGTDVRMQYEALKLRREYLRRKADEAESRRERAAADYCTVDGGGAGRRSRSTMRGLGPPS